MAWIILFLAGLLEIMWAYSMKQSDGFTRLVPSLTTIAALVASLALLSLSARSLPLGTAYAVWSGIGAIGTFVVGVVALGESLSPMRVAAAVLIVSGLALMKLAGDA